MIGKIFNSIRFASFAALYAAEFKDSSDKKMALQYALKRQRHRKPFSSLTDNQIDRLADLFSQLKDPLQIQNFWIEADNQRTIGPLVDFERLEDFVKFAKKHEA